MADESGFIYRVLESGATDGWVRLAQPQVGDVFQMGQRFYKIGRVHIKQEPTMLPSGISDDPDEKEMGVIAATVVNDAPEAVRRAFVQ